MNVGLTIADDLTVQLGISVAPRPYRRSESPSTNGASRTAARLPTSADLIQSRKHGAPVWGVLYDLSPQALDRLTTIEGRGYRARRIAVRDSKGLRKIVTTFVVRHQQRRTRLATTADYIGHIVRGLREHGAPNDYVQGVIDVALETNLRAAGAEDVETQRIALLRDRR
jgi:hypothetical protein